MNPLGSGRKSARVGPKERRQARRRAAAMSPEDRREAIVRSTLPLLRKHGANVTTRQIAQAAGIAEGTIFRAFEDKDELLRVCVLEGFRTDELCIAIHELPDADVSSRLTDAALLFLDYFTHIGELMRTLATTGYDLSRHGPQGEHPISEAREEFMSNLAEAFASVLAPAEHRLRVPASELAPMVLSQVIGIRFAPTHQDDQRAGVRKRIDVLLHGAFIETETS